MNSDERGYVTVEHAIGFVAVTLVVGVIVARARGPPLSGRPTRRERPRPRTRPDPTRCRVAVGG